MSTHTAALHCRNANEQCMTKSSTFKYLLWLAYASMPFPQTDNLQNVFPVSVRVTWPDVLFCDHCHRLSLCLEACQARGALFCTRWLRDACWIKWICLACGSNMPIGLRFQLHITHQTTPSKQTQPEHSEPNLTSVNREFYRWVLRHISIFVIVTVAASFHNISASLAGPLVELGKSSSSCQLLPTATRSSTFTCRQCHFQAGFSAVSEKRMCSSAAA